MFFVAEAIKTRLASRPEFAGWQISTDADDLPRDTAPALHIRLESGGIKGASSRAMRVSPQWGVYLVVRRGTTATAVLDAAFQAALCALMDFYPGKNAGLSWERLSPTSIPAPEFTETGLVAYGFLLETAATYHAAD